MLVFCQDSGTSVLFYLMGDVKPLLSSTSVNFHCRAWDLLVMEGLLEGGGLLFMIRPLIQGWHVMVGPVLSSNKSNCRISFLELHSVLITKSILHNAQSAAPPKALLINLYL